MGDIIPPTSIPTAEARQDSEGANWIEKQIKKN